MKKHILCLGDSNTYGYCADPTDCADAVHLRFDETERWTELLQQQLGEDYLVIEEGLNGRTTVFPDPLSPGMSALDYLHPCLMSHIPISLLVIMLGTNDVKERMSASPTCVALGMRRLAMAAQSVPCWRADSGPNILIVAPYPIQPGVYTSEKMGTMGAGCAEKSQELAALYAPVAQELGCHFLDAGQLVDPYNHLDFMHLTRDGHRQMAQLLGDTIPSICP